MLLYLHIKNIALVDEIEIDFMKGLNIVTGETGAGKSAIVGSLNFILGERFDTAHLRSGQEKALIESVYDISQNSALKTHLDTSGISFEEKEFLVKREVSKDGRGKCYVCGNVVTLAMLKKIGDYLVDIHGQHDHQSVLDVMTHTGIVDKFGGTDKELEAVKRNYDLYAKLKKRRDDLSASFVNKERELEFLNHQLSEIKKADLRENEDDILGKEHDILSSGAHLNSVSSEVYSGLYEDDNSLISALSRIQSSISDLAKYQASFEPYSKSMTEMGELLRETADAVRDFRDNIDVSGERLEQVEERLALIERLKKKYGGTLAAVLDHQEELSTKVDLLVNSDEELKRCDEDLRKSLADLKLSANKLSKKRKSVAVKLSSLIEGELRMLGMEAARFDTVLVACEIGPEGAERAEFFISPNKGEDLKPMKIIASGGEISRTMLAIKKIIAYTDRIGTLIFDEVDVNIGGRLANVVGERLKDISKNKQVICITHLPQIASRADHHMYVEKDDTGSKVTTKIKKLTDNERAEEISRMLGSAGAAGTAGKLAKEMLKQTVI